MAYKFSIDINGVVETQMNRAKLIMKGQLFYKDFKYTATNIAELFSETSDLESIKELLKSHILPQASGRFLIMICLEDSMIVIADIVRSYPLFYHFTDHHCSLSENLSSISAALEIEEAKLEEYVVAGFVYGNSTMYKGVYGMQAGEMICISRGAFTSERYFEFKSAANCPKSIDFTKAFNDTMIRVFKRILQCKADPKASWILPLSGGHDSRIVANYLHLLGVKNVICFSYGVAGNAQSAISRQVAEVLGYKWYFVEYNEQKWKDLHDNGSINKYINIASNGTSTPHLQDFLAVYELRLNGVIKPGDVFLPGHTLDFISGNHLKDADLQCETKQAAVKLAFNRHCLLKNELARPISRVSQIYDQSAVSPQQFQEYFNWQERQAKFIVNSVRVYEFFGFEACLPFWDREIVEFWLSISRSERAGRNLFLATERAGILADSLAQIPFEDEIKPKKKENKVHVFLSKAIPGALVLFLLRLTKKKAKFNEGLNQIYALSAGSVAELIGPLKDFPEHVHVYIDPYLKRFPYQINYHLLSCLYAARIQINKQRK